MFIAGFDVKQIVGSLAAVIFIFASIFSAANLILNLGKWAAAKNATERELWSGRWFRPALALAFCAAAVYIVLFFVL